MLHFLKLSFVTLEVFSLHMHYLGSRFFFPAPTI